MKQIIVEVSPDGEITIATSGFKGPACLKESKFLKDLLGKELSRQLTPAYYEENKKKIKKYLNLCGERRTDGI
jgi:predicted flavoprotein YhiN